MRTSENSRCGPARTPNFRGERASPLKNARVDTDVLFDRDPAIAQQDVWRGRVSSRKSTLGHKSVEVERAGGDNLFAARADPRALWHRRWPSAPPKGQDPASGETRARHARAGVAKQRAHLKSPLDGRRHIVVICRVDAPKPLRHLWALADGCDRSLFFCSGRREQATGREQLHRALRWIVARFLSKTHREVDADVRLHALPCKYAAAPEVSRSLSPERTLDVPALLAANPADGRRNLCGRPRGQSAPNG